MRKVGIFNSTRPSGEPFTFSFEDSKTQFRAPGKQLDDLTVEDLDPPDEVQGPVLSWEMLAPYIDMLPPVEADIIELRYRCLKTEKEIGEIFDLSQAGVSHREGSGLRRIKIYMSLPVVDYEAVRPALLKLAADPIHVDTLLTFLRIGSQTIVAETLGVTQSRVRHVTKETWPRLLQGVQGLEHVLERLEIINDNMHMVAPQRSTWDAARKERQGQTRRKK